MMDSKAIGRKIRELRSRVGLTTVTLGKKIRVSQAQISRLENGLQGFRQATLAKIAKVLSVPPMYFYVEGTEDATAGVAKDLNKHGMKASRSLRKALALPAFLRFMEKCAKAYNRSPKNLEKLEAAIKSRILPRL